CSCARGWGSFPAHRYRADATSAHRNTSARCRWSCHPGAPYAAHHNKLGLAKPCSADRESGRWVSKPFFLLRLTWWHQPVLVVTLSQAEGWLAATDTGL